jgi:hypothetical protein
MDTHLPQGILTCRLREFPHRGDFDSGIMTKVSRGNLMPTALKRKELVCLNAKAF